MSGWNTVDFMTPYDARLMPPPCTSPVLHHRRRQLCCNQDLSYIQIQTSPRSLCHRQLLLMGTDLICGRHQLFNHIHVYITSYFPLSLKADTTSNPVIGEGVNAPALLWPNGDAQFMHRNPSPVLTLVICNSQLLDQSPEELTSY